MSNPILKSFTFVPQPKVSNDPVVRITKIEDLIVSSAKGAEIPNRKIRKK